jgi:predicted dehydrogenase
MGLLHSFNPIKDEETAEMDISRRKFMGGTAGAVLAAGTMAQRSVFGANERIQVAVVGINGRGGSHIGGFSDLPGSEIAALCDPDSRVLERRAKGVEEKTGKAPKQYGDLREVMADDSIDVVTIATPNHWHTLAAIWALQAGKDVYVEKPCAHSVWEGRQLATAAEKYSDRIVQHGTQRRSDARWIRDLRLMKEGIIGDVYMARGLGYKSGSRGSIGIADNEAPPPHLNWDLWQGPASEQAYCKNYHPYRWHWFWHYGNGEIGNQGVHQMDVCAWGMDRGLPVKISSAGGRYTYDDQGETPNTQVTTMTYADGTMTVFEVRNRYTNDESGVKVGNLFYGSEGYYVEGKGFFDKRDKPIEVTEPMPEMPAGGHYGTFLNAVHTRDRDAIHGTAMDGHLSAAHCHLGNISYRVGRTVHFDPATETFGDDAEANALLKREYREPYVVPQLA